MTLRDRITLAQRYIRAAERHIDGGRTERAREAMIGARSMLTAVQNDDYEEALRDGRSVQVDRADLLERLVSGTEETFSPERDLRAHDSAARGLT